MGQAIMGPDLCTTSTSCSICPELLQFTPSNIHGTVIQHFDDKVHRPDSNHSWTVTVHELQLGSSFGRPASTTCLTVLSSLVSPYQSDHRILSDSLLIMHDAFTSLDLGLVGDLLESVLQVVAGIAIFRGSDNDPGCVGEQVVHLFERTAGGLREKQPEEDGVGEVANLCCCQLRRFEKLLPE